MAVAMFARRRFRIRPSRSRPMRSSASPRAGSPVRTYRAARSRSALYLRANEPGSCRLATSRARQRLSASSRGCRCDQSIRCVSLPHSIATKRCSPCCLPSCTGVTSATPSCASRSCQRCELPSGQCSSRICRNTHRGGCWSSRHESDATATTVRRVPSRPLLLNGRAANPRRRYI
jgi:hypothetical protein